MKAFVFPGQGAQFVGMGKDLYENNATAHDLFEKANDILGFRITDLMFNGTEDDLKQTRVTQPAVFLHSVILAKTMGDEFAPDMVAGHSLGELSALTAAGALSFEDGLRLVSARAKAMQKACEIKPSTMAAIIALPDEKVEEICAATPGVVVAANYNCPGQVVISGEIEAINAACEAAKAAGAKRALPLKVGVQYMENLVQKPPEGGGRLPFATHGACTRRTGRSHRGNRVPHTRVRSLPECRCQGSHQPRRNQSQPRCSAHRPRALDTERAEHGGRRCRPFHRSWSRQGASGSRFQNQPRSSS